MPLVPPGMKTVFPEMFMCPASVLGARTDRDRLSGDRRSLAERPPGG
jgi:hypothetical protein